MVAFVQPHTQSRSYRGPFEYPVPPRTETGGRVAESIKIKEFSPPTSLGLQQRIIAAYNLETGNFDPTVFLAYPSQPSPSPTETRACLARVKARTIDPMELIGALPYHTQEAFERSLYFRDNKGRLDQRIFDALRRLYNLRVGDNLQPCLDDFYVRYGPGSGNDIFSLIAGLQSRGVDRVTICKLISNLHGESRLLALRGIFDLKKIAQNDPRSWKRYCNATTRHLYNDEEWLIKQARRDLGLSVAEAEVPKKPKETKIDIGDLVEKIKNRVGSKKKAKKQKKSLPLRSSNRQEHICCVSEEVWRDHNFGFVQNIGNGKYDHQEDSYQAKILQVQGGKRIMFSANDGMGGHAYGDVASKIVASCLDRAEISREGIFSALNSAHWEVQEKTDRLGGSTAAVAFIDEYNRLFAYNCGDSRILVYRNGQIIFFTQDHSWVQEQLRYGTITPEEARVHAKRNVITASIGTNYEVAEYEFTQLQKGDVVLAVTDGIIDPLQNQGIANIIYQNYNKTPQKIAESLITPAYNFYPKKHGDNLTAVCYKVP